jgi:hypothetical protein
VKGLALFADDDKNVVMREKKLQALLFALCQQRSMSMKTRIQNLLISLTILAIAHQAIAQGTAFTYQGRLNVGTNQANGSYDLTFALFSASSGAGQVGNTVTNLATAVTNGLFTVPLDFGANFPGTSRWLEISVRTNGASAFVTLNPRQLLTPTPYAIFAQTAASLNNGFGNLPSGGQSAIGGGAWNYASGSYATIAGGNSNTNTGYSSTIGGGINNTVTVGSYATISGGEGNTVNNASDAVIGGGRANRVGQAFSTVSGGIFNDAEDFFSFIGGGSNNVVQWGGKFSVIAGGTLNNTAGSYSFIGGGDNNTAGNYATVGGGSFDNANGQNATVSGGTLNNALGDYSVIGGGFQNTAGSPQSFIGGGYLNSASGTNSVVAGGYLNRAYGNYDFVGGGKINVANGVFSTVAGGASNIASNDVSTVSGGMGNIATGSYSTIAGGVDNTNTGSFGSIGGGGYNTVNGGDGTIAGGFDNTAGGSATVGGGQNNSAVGSYSTISGGQLNIASGYMSTVPGGILNSASGSYCFAAGYQAQAIHQGAFVWADTSGGSLSSTAANQFTARASGGVRFFSNSGATAGVSLAPGGTSWATISDRNAKKNFTPVSAEKILGKLAAMPIEQWNYKWEPDNATPNIGPMAQDFVKAFYPGRDDKSITTLEFDGVELAAIQGLNQKLNDKDAEIQELKQSVAELKKLVQSLAEKK